MPSEFIEQIKAWRSILDVDVNLLAEIRGVALINGLKTILDKDSSALHRIVIETNQHGTMSGYAETTQSHKGFVGRFRNACNWDDGISDEELYQRIGSWYFDSYEYGYFEAYPESAQDAEYAFWNETDEVCQGADCYHNASAIGAVLKMEASDVFRNSEKSDDFEVRLFDGNCYEWAANEWLIEKRTKG